MRRLLELAARESTGRAGSLPRVPRAGALTCVALAVLGGCFADTRDHVDSRELALEGGRLAVLDEVPGLVGVRGTMGTGVCGGLLFSPTEVLTAAHCVAQFDASGFTGEAEPASGVEVYPRTLDLLDGASVGVAEVRIHPDFPGSRVGADPDGLGNETDLAVLRLREPLAEPSPAVFATPAELEARVGGPLTMVGYGFTDEFGTTDGLLHIGEATLVRHRGGEFLADGMVRACSGDSGSPAYVTGPDGLRAAGIVSRTTLGSVDRYCGPSIYAALPDHASWIEGAPPSSEGGSGGCGVTGRSGDGSLPGPCALMVLVLLARRRDRATPPSSRPPRATQHD